MQFCVRAGRSPVPASEPTLCSFVSYLANEGLKHRTLKVYLSAVRHLHIERGLQDPFQGKPSPRLQYVLRGIKKHEAEKGVERRERFPMSPALLYKLRSVWAQSGGERDTKMLRAVCCLAFFAFLRAGELTVPSDREYDATVHLSRGDIEIENPRSPSALSVRIKQSKTDPFRRGVSLYVGHTRSALCPVAAILDYLCARGPDPGPLFTFSDGRYQTKQRFVSAIREALKRAGVDQSKYSGHSFRIRAATTAASRGMEDSIIQTLGRWESLAYLQYVQIPRPLLAGYSNLLAAP